MCPTRESDHGDEDEIGIIVDQHVSHTNFDVGTSWASTLATARGPAVGSLPANRAQASCPTLVPPRRIISTARHGLSMVMVFHRLANVNHARLDGNFVSVRSAKNSGVDTACMFDSS